MQYTDETMLDMFIFETVQLIEQLETSILTGEKSHGFAEPAINEIFRVMHTIKSCAAMMMFDNISRLAHTVEDLFFCLREEKPSNVDFSALSDLVFNSIDFIKAEIQKIKSGKKADGDVTQLILDTGDFLAELKRNNPAKKGLEKSKDGGPQHYYISPKKGSPEVSKHYFKALVRFQEGCQMEEVRAFGVVHRLKGITNDLFYRPQDIVENDATAEIIRRDGFQIYFSTELTYTEIHNFFMETVFLDELELVELEDKEDLNRLFEAEKGILPRQATEPNGFEGSEDKRPAEQGEDMKKLPTQQSFISVSVPKLDTLMDLVGEMVIAEAMVIQNPDLEGLELDNFYKAAMQLKKITGEIQDIVMSVRMVPLTTTFHRMQRIIRDMSKKLDKQIELQVIGANTEVDKNVIERITDPLMHLVRNSADHGIEPYQERLQKGKPGLGTITLEAKNQGSDVIINIKDDGRGLDREKILQRAREKGLLSKPPEEMSEREIFNLILLPGFSMKEDVSQFSGRGVGMNVVTENIEAIGGSVSVSSVFGEGTVISLKIPLTLAIIDGMNLKVGNSRYTMPTISIRESFRPLAKDIITDPDGNEMIMVRGKTHPILRLHKLYRVQTDVTDFTKGILVMIEQDEKTACVFVDELLGQQQVVVKSLPEFIRKNRKITGLAGCTLLGDGSISLILEPASLVGL